MSKNERVTLIGSQPGTPTHTGLNFSYPEAETKTVYADVIDAGLELRQAIFGDISIESYVVETLDDEAFPVRAIEYKGKKYNVRNRTKMGRHTVYVVGD